MIDRAQVEAAQEKYEEAVEFMKTLTQKGNAYRIVIRKPSGRVFMELSLTKGALVTGVFLYFLPRLVAVIALVALCKKASVDIVRSGGDE